MTPEEFHRVQEIFLEAAELADADRAAFLETACDGSETIRAEVERMLAADLGASAVSRLGAVAVANQISCDHTARSLPLRLGSYEIVRQLGQGGMGIVYEAIQAKPHRSVAVKVLMPGAVSTDGAARFELEGELLGRLHHPGIAQVYESGVASTDAGEQPYLVMELVDGIPLTDYVEQQQPNLIQRLELFRSICDAVAHAHQRGVIHRDLKPSNLLVTNDGAVKVLDFGVARTTDADLRATTRQTQMGQLIGTIPYMSPEQCSGQARAVDTRSDIYALGVILYELLSGQLPYELDSANIPQALRTIQEAPPVPLRRYDPRFRGDLTTIVNRALAKDPDHRYGSADALQDDLRCYLQHQPIAACAPSAAYVVRKFAARHRVPFALACSLLLLLVVAAVGGTLLSLNLAHQRNLAQKSQQQEAEARVAAESAVTFLDGLFAESNPETWRESEMSVRDLVQRGVDRLETELVDQPLPRARLQLTLGKVLTTLGDLEKAEELLVQSRDTFGKELGENDVAVADACFALSNLYDARSKPKEGQAAARRALAIRELHFDSSHPLVIETVKRLATSHFNAGEWDEALQLSRDALGRAKQSLGDVHEVTLECTNNVAGPLINMGGQENLDEAEAILLGVLPEDPASTSTPEPTAKSYDWLMRIYHQRGDMMAARKAGQDGLVILRRIRHADHPDVLWWEQQLAFLSEIQASIPIMRSVLERRRRIYEPQHPYISLALALLGQRLRDVGEFEEAEQMLAERLAINRHVSGNQHPSTGWAAHDMAVVNYYLQSYVDAERLWLEAYEILKPHFAADRLAAITNSLAKLYKDLDRTEDAEHWEKMGSMPNVDGARDYADRTAAQFGAETLRSAKALHGFGGVLIKTNQYDKAEEPLRDALQIRQTLLGDNNVLVADTAHALGRALYHQQRHDEAKDQCQLALQIWNHKHPTIDHRRYGKLQRELQLAQEAAETDEHVASKEEAAP